MKRISLLLLITLGLVTLYPSIHAEAEEQDSPEIITPDDVDNKDPQQPEPEQVSEQPKPKNLTPYLFRSIAQGNDLAVRHFISQGADINKSFGEKGDAPLLYAIRALHTLVNNFNNVVFNDVQTFTMAYNIRFEIIRFLLYQPGIHLGAENLKGETALIFASREGLVDVQNLILNKIQTNVIQPSSDIDKYKQNLVKLAIPEELRKKISLAIDKAANSQLAIHEAGLMNNYLKLIFSLPWDKRTEDNKDLKAIQEILDQDHYGLTKVKNEITDYIAVRILQDLHHQKGNTQALCLVGPPGVGKTSIAKSIARALGKSFAKVSLGGVYEEQSIRGFSKTYIGAEPGKIIKALISQPKNLVMLLDEIDKMGASAYHGSPASALLELLDPIQNHEFMDHYLDIPFDMSEVFFIATANSHSDIPYALWDRLKIINVNSYIQEEKLMIAKKHIIPKLLKEFVLEESGLSFSDELINFLIQHYTYEAGVRKLEQRLKTLCTKAVHSYLQNKEVPTFTSENVAQYLGSEYIEDYAKNFFKENTIGIAQGMTVSFAGGNVLIIETALMPGEGKIVITGMIQQMMEESVNIARGYIKSHLQELGVSPDIFAKNDIHIHFPEGATPKDGPSAGTAILSALTSLITQRPYDISYAMTGELTLTGRVLPIGGLKEKLTAAKRMGIKKILIPQANYHHINDFKELVQDMEIIPVSHAKEVLDRVLLPRKN